MTAVDSSVVIAACVDWHEVHVTALTALGERRRLIAHCALETYSTLTRLPEARRMAAGFVAQFLRHEFPDDPLLLPGQRMREIVDELQSRGISGGATYDGLIGLTAAEHGAELLTLDRRAEQTYRRCGVNYRLLA